MSRARKGDTVRVRMDAKALGPSVRGMTGKVVEVAHDATYPLRVKVGNRPDLIHVTHSEVDVVDHGFAPGIDGEVKNAERRSAQLRSLRSLANKLGYTLVKNTDQEVTA